MMISDLHLAVLTFLPWGTRGDRKLDLDNRATLCLPPPPPSCPVLAGRTRFILSPSWSAEPHMDPARVFSTSSSLSSSLGGRSWGEDLQSDRASSWLGTRWELHPKKPWDLPGYLLKERKEMLPFSPCWGISRSWERISKDWRVGSRLWEWGVPGFPGYPWVTEVTTGARALDPREAATCLH